MKRLHFLFITALIAFTGCINSEKSKLVILHTNDTHSQIDPDETGCGGILRRKALIDSVRHAEENVLLVDAGDAVQGSLYYLLYYGKVETLMMNELGYDIAILGNHEFDLGMDSLLRQYRNLTATKLTTNYDLSATALDTLFVPYTVKEYNGTQIGLIGLNVNPDGLISARKCVGVKYSDVISVANSTAEMLKTQFNIDYVIALTHIGYDNRLNGLPDDVTLAQKSRNIDIIIGGHSHTTINPDTDPTEKYIVKNADGKDVLIAQSGSRGRYLGEITIDLNSGETTSRLIQVNSRLDKFVNVETAKILAPYKVIVDSLLSIEVAQSAVKLNQDGEQLINLVSDFIKVKGSELSGKEVDLAMMNRGGIRNGLPLGTISEGDLMMAFPFDNRITVIEITGADLLEAFDIIASRNHISLSQGSHIVYDADCGKCTISLVDNNVINPNEKYLLATIDYLAEGGDGMKPLAKGNIIATSGNELRSDLISYLSEEAKKGVIINPDTTKRVIPAKRKQ